MNCDDVLGDASRAHELPGGLVKRQVSIQYF